MKKIIAIIAITILSAQIRAQVPSFACFGGCIMVNNDTGTYLVHIVRSNVFPIAYFMKDFKASDTDWQQLIDKVTAEATRQLDAKGYHTSIQYPILLSNYADQQKTQEALDLWESRTPSEIQVLINANQAVGFVSTDYCLYESWCER